MESGTRAAAPAVLEISARAPSTRLDWGRKAASGSSHATQRQKAPILLTGGRRCIASGLMKIVSWWPTVKAGVRSHDSSSARAPVIGQHAPRWIIQSAPRHKLLPLTAMAITAPRFFLLGEINRRPFRSMLLDQLVSIGY